MGKVFEDHVKTELKSQENKCVESGELVREPEYSTVDECSHYLRKNNCKAKKQSGNQTQSVKEQTYFRPFDDDQLFASHEPITPYACFYGPSVKKIKAGWLDKLSPQGYVIFYYDLNILRILFVS